MNRQEPNRPNESILELDTENIVREMSKNKTKIKSAIITAASSGGSRELVSNNMCMMAQIAVTRQGWGRVHQLRKLLRRSMPEAYTHKQDAKLFLFPSFQTNLSPGLSSTVVRHNSRGTIRFPGKNR